MKRMMNYEVTLIHDECDEKTNDPRVINAMEQVMQEFQDFIVGLRRKFRTAAFRIITSGDLDVQELKEDEPAAKDADYGCVGEEVPTEQELVVKIGRQEMVRRNLEALVSVYKLDDPVTKELAKRKIKEHLKKLNA